MHDITGRPLHPGEAGAPGPGRRAIELTRRFDTTPERLWHFLATRDGLERWLGSYEGDPSSGAVTFRLTAEGADAETVVVHIVACRPGGVLRVAAAIGDDRWDVDVAITDDDAAAHADDDDAARADDVDGAGRASGADACSLHFVHRSDDTPGFALIGAAWEFYLDRLEAAVRGADVEELDFADYGDLAGTYDRLLDEPAAPRTR